MNINTIVPLEDCFDGSFIKEVSFDEQINIEFINYIGQFGNLNYYSTFLKPFYKINVPKKFILKGVEGNTTARIILFRETLNLSIDYFIHIVDKYDKTITKKEI